MKLDVIYSYYNQADLLEKYLNHWNNNINNNNNINFIIVDDHSKHKASDIINCNKKINYNLQCYYIKDNKGFNLAGARNLGVEKSKTNNVLILDFDIIIYQDLIEEILNWELNENICYRFKQKTVKGFDFENNKFMYKVHHSMMYLKKSLYSKAGGTDEDFVGNYGYEDVYLRHYLKYKLKTKFKYINKNKIYQISTGKSKNVNRDHGSEINKKLFDNKITTYPKPNNNIRFKYELEYENLL